jgi:nicotinate-nucleotide pyrophosphorylase (carboxylating)
VNGRSTSPQTEAALDEAGLRTELVMSRVQMALDEDLAYGPDVTTLATVPEDRVVVAAMALRKDGVVAGLPVALATLDVVVGPGRWQLQDLVGDGTALAAGAVAMRVTAPARELLTAERTMLNFVCHMSGVATLTSRWALAVAPVRVRDTRKTLPGFRELDKYAVRCGGGANHRMGLGDAALVKDNHIASAGGLGPAVEAIRRHDATVPLEVECDTLEQVQEAIEAGVDLVLLDNMSVPQMQAAVELAELAERAGRREGERVVRFEASGGLRLEDAPPLSTSGVDFVAVGALTHSAPVLDLGLDVEEVADASVLEGIGRVGR